MRSTRNLYSSKPLLWQLFNSSDPGPIIPNFKPIKDFKDFIAALVTCKNEDDPIKNEGTTVLTTLYIDFLDAQGRLTQ